MPSVFVSKVMADLGVMVKGGKGSLMLMLAVALLGCATTAGSLEQRRSEARVSEVPSVSTDGAEWDDALKRCSSVRFDQPSWEQRAELCAPLLGLSDQASVPASVWQQARQGCRALEHEAACLPFGYLLRGSDEQAVDRAVFRDAMQQLDSRMWAQANIPQCRDMQRCEGVLRYLELFGDGGEHAAEAHQLTR